MTDQNSLGIMGVAIYGYLDTTPCGGVSAI